jgi:hypothetical protein
MGRGWPHATLTPSEVACRPPHKQWVAREPLQNWSEPPLGVAATLPPTLGVVAQPPHESGVARSPSSTLGWHASHSDGAGVACGHPWYGATGCEKPR